MGGQTEYRDAWAATKQANLPQIFQATTNLAKEISRCGIELNKLMQQLGSSASFQDFYAGVERLSEVSRSISYNVHNLKAHCDFLPPSTLFTDHFLNQFYFMSIFKRTWWVEGPAFCGLAIEPGSRILELGCGTGYFTDIFFSPFASEIVAIDIDPRGIETARRMHQARNVRYEVMDCRKELPDGPFDIVVWTPSIFAYTPDEVHTLMGKLREVMSSGARLCGWTFVEIDHPGPQILWHDMKSLAERLKRHFANVRTFERTHSTITPSRQAIFFYASDGMLPFDAEWPHGMRSGNLAD